MKSKAAFLLALQTLGEKGLYMWTFTFRDIPDLKATRSRWNHLLTLMRQRWPKLVGLRVFELHKNHGLHVHLVTNRRIDVVEVRRIADMSGWGRIHVQRIAAKRAKYLAKTLGQQRPACLRGWRLWAGFGDWDRTKVKDVSFDCAATRIYRACSVWLNWRGNSKYTERRRLVSRLEVRTLIEEWEPGLGPNGKPYAECSTEELFGIGEPGCGLQAD